MLRRLRRGLRAHLLLLRWIRARIPLGRGRASVPPRVRAAARGRLAQRHVPGIPPRYALGLTILAGLSLSRELCLARPFFCFAHRAPTTPSTHACLQLARPGAADSARRGRGLGGGWSSPENCRRAIEFAPRQLPDARICGAPPAQFWPTSSQFPNACPSVPPPQLALLPRQGMSGASCNL